MNYYQHHIGDFNNATRHLTRVERALYRDLIELYYDTESPLQSEFESLARRVLARDEQEKTALKVVLDDFFRLESDGYHNKRCDEEIAKYRAHIESKSKAGRASAASRQQNSTDVKQVFNECATNQEPRTNNQEPIIKTKTSMSGDARRISWEFLAGIIDGEACVRLNRYEQNGDMRITPRVTIYNTNLKLLESIRDGLGIGSISSRERPSENAKDLHELNFTRDEIEKIVEHCAAHVVAKREQFSMLADFLAHWPQDKAYCEALHERTKHLNARGKPDDDPPISKKINGHRAESQEVLEFLNMKTGRAYRPVDANLSIIAARLKEGASVADCRMVIAKKTREWRDDEKMSPYLRPATLFNKTKFAQYVGELVEPKEGKHAVS